MSSFYDQASWLLIPSGIEEDIVFAQKPISGLGDLSFTRASDATYTDASGVVRRSPYNLLTFSEDFSNAAWFKQQMNVSSNVAANPLTGVVNADLLVPDTTSNNHRIFQIATVSSSIQSVYLKAAGYNYVSFGKGGGTSGSGIIFNLSNGTVSGSASGFSGTISPAGNGWYLCSLISSGATNDYASISNWIIIRDNSTNLVFTGDGTSGVLVANAQLVEGNEVLPYFPTTNRQDVPRIDFRNADGTLSSCGRLLLEPQRTNSIRNSSMVGAVAGSPGTAPTNWLASGIAGLSRTILGTGTENGLPYIDIRLNGTATGTNAQVQFDSLISASVGQAWTNSIYFKIVSITNAPNSYFLNITELDSSGNYLTEGNQAFTPTSTLNRYSFTRTLANASVGRVLPIIRINLTSGQTYDFTIRIAAPQMELGAYATTWVPTTTAAVTRLADAFTRNNIYTNGLISAAGGTWFVEFDNNVAYTGGITQAQLLGLGNNAVGATADNIFFACSGFGRIRVWMQIAGTLSSVYLTTTDKTKLAIKWNGTTMDVFENGVKVVTATSFTPTSLQTLRTIATQHPYNISQSALAPTPLSDAQCIQLTTL